MASPLDLVIRPDFRALIPALRPEEYEGLRASLQREGCRDAIVVWGETIVDGHNRYEICRSAGIEYRAKSLSFAGDLEAQLWIRENQLSRRNLTDDQRALIAAEVAEDRASLAKRERAKKGREAGGDATPEQVAERQKRLDTDAVPERVPVKRDRASRAAPSAAKSAGVSERKVRQAQVVRKADPILAAKVRTGEITLAGAVREVRRVDQVSRLEDIGTREVKRLAGVFDVVVIDPPWPMEKIERECRPNQAEMDYPTMTEAELAELRIPAASDCHLWLWTTQRFLPMAFRLLGVWCFKYVCTFVWAKPGGFQPIGLPQYNCEFSLYARRGSPSFVETKGFSTCFSAPRGGHSEKPGEFYEVVRRVTAGRRVDMFSRRLIVGFEGWGQEVAGGLRDE